MLHFEIIATMRSPVNETESQTLKKNRNIKKKHKSTKLWKKKVDGYLSGAKPLDDL